MIVTVAIGLYTSRVILQALGVENYGIYGVIGGVVSIFATINSSMSVSTSRFISFELGNNDIKELVSTYNQAVIIHLIIACIVFIITECVGLWFIYNKLVIPPERMNAALWVFHCSLLVCILNILSTPNIALVISHEKMSTFAYITVMDCFLRLFVALVLLHYYKDRLILYAILLLLIQVIDRSIYLIYCRRKFPEAKSTLILHGKKFKKMLSFACWNFMGNLALISISQGVNILLNIFFGPAVNAARSLADQVSNQLVAFGNNIRMAINPQITKSYATGDLEYMHNLIIYSSKSFFFMLLCGILPFFCVTELLLKLWLVEVPEYTTLFVKLTLIYILLDSFANPIIIATHATGDIRKFQIVEGCLMLLTLPFAYILLKMGFPPFMVYAAQIVVALISQIGRLSVALPKIKFEVRKYFTRILFPILLVVLISILPVLAINFYKNTVNYTYVSCIQGCISFFVVIVTIYWVGLNRKERSYLFSIIKR
jgi:O-antigen/teichoic acid export membrane protein